MEYINILNIIITIISFTVNLFFLIPFLYKFYKYFTQKRYIKKVLGYNSSPVEIYLSTRKFNSNGYDFVTYNIIEGVQNILNIFDIINQKFLFVNKKDSARNEMCIGGFINNKRVNTYFSKYFKTFKYYIDESLKKYHDLRSIDTQMIEYSTIKKGFQIYDGLFLDTQLNKKDYAFLIKLTPNDFSCDKTVHILFGGKSISTIKATEYLKTYYKDIYKNHKNGHYFLAIEINLVTNSFNFKDGIIDLTDKMFTN